MSQGYVLNAEEQPMQPGSGMNVNYRVAINRATGCQNLEQRIFQYEPGGTLSMSHAASEEVMYVVSGQGRAVIDGRSYPLSPGIGILAPPGSQYRLENTASQDLWLVSILSPQPGQPTYETVSHNTASQFTHIVNEAEQKPLPAGDRWFKLLIDPRVGCQHVTQFVGFIPPGRAPAHTHTYEEVIYILEGEGIVHIGSGDFPVKAGSSVYLPPLLPHCIENVARTPLRVLGVFSPAGDPSSKASEEDHS